MLILSGQIYSFEKKFRKKDASLVFFKCFITFAYDPTESLIACTRDGIDENENILVLKFDLKLRPNIHHYVTNGAGSE